MRKVHLNWHPAHATDVVSFDDFYDELKDTWRQKSRDLQSRRWRKLRERSA